MNGTKIGHEHDSQEVREHWDQEKHNVISIARSRGRIDQLAFVREGIVYFESMYQPFQSAG